VRHLLLLPLARSAHKVGDGHAQGVSDRVQGVAAGAVPAGFDVSDGSRGEPGGVGQLLLCEVAVQSLGADAFGDEAPEVVQAGRWFEHSPTLRVAMIVCHGRILLIV
jgi:hypothetical protein